jgi:hypothetical protein
VPGRSCLEAYERAVGGRSRVTFDRGGNGPSRALAGLTGLLPGIGSNAVPRVGTIGVSASRSWKSTFEVSQESNASECVVIVDVVSDVVLESREKDSREVFSNLVLELTGRTTWCSE